jgi:nucleotide-binding universal stress UspA family protein
MSTSRDPLLRHVACCVDASASGSSAVERTQALCGDVGRLSIVHVAPHPLLFDEVDGALVPSAADINVARRQWLERLVGRAPGTSGVFLEGLPGPEICAWAAANGVDLIVAAAHAHGVRRIAALGSVTRYLVDRAPCSVLVLRANGVTGSAAPSAPCSAERLPGTPDHEHGGVRPVRHALADAAERRRPAEAPRSDHE